MVFVASLFAAPGSVFAADRHAGQDRPGPEMAIEHAQARLDVPGQYAVFLTIWNGTRQPRHITAIDVDRFDQVTIASHATEGVVFQPVARAVVTIPANSELHMDTDTLFVALHGQGSPIDTAVTVTFDDGTAIKSRLSLLQPGQKVTDHRHD